MTSSYRSSAACHADALLEGRRVVFFEKVERIPRLDPDSWLVDVAVMPDAHNFVLPRENPLWDVLRRRNFEAAVAPVHRLVSYGTGWHQAETADGQSFRWTGKEAQLLLPPVHGTGLLSAKIYVPVDAIQPPPDVELWSNGRLVDRFSSGDGYVEKTWRLPSRLDAFNDLRIVTSAVVVPGNGDSRELGLRFDAISWRALRTIHGSLAEDAHH